MKPIIQGYIFLDPFEINIFYELSQRNYPLK